MPKRKVTCDWCFGTKDVMFMYVPQSPVLEWMEEKLILLDGEFRDQDLTKEEEWEILVYDELVTSITRGKVCKKCWKKDQKLYEKYYDQDDEDNYLRII